MDTRKVVEERLLAAPPCRHCEENTSPTFIPADEMLLVAYVCPTGYVSRLINYGDRIDVARFKGFLLKTAGKCGEVKDADIRAATRYTWDMGMPSSNEGGVVIRGAFWAQNYRGNKSSDPDRAALFLCTRCKSNMFVQPLSGRGTLCEDCRRKESPA